MNILLVATESLPYRKTGVLGELVFGLAKELCAQENDARIVIPCYRGSLGINSSEKVVSTIEVPLGLYSRNAKIWKSGTEPITYLVQDDHDFYFERNDVYGYLDDYERFIFFTRAALQMFSDPQFCSSEGGWIPDIIHGYDWATGLMPGWISQYYKKEFAETRFILSIHNIGKTGTFGHRAIQVAGQKEKGIFEVIGEDVDHINFLGRGIMEADKIITVNPNYDSDNPLPSSAKSIEDILILRKKDICGIRSGIDYEVYDSFTDPNVKFPYRETSLKNRVKNKIAFQRSWNFTQNAKIPLMGMVTRLIPAKGIDLLSQTLKQSLSTIGPVQLTILADTGAPHYMKLLEQLKEDTNGGSNLQVEIQYGYDEQFAGEIFSSVDLFLIPSKEEPAGIQQYIAMHYGAVPVVHRTGVLSDAVLQFDSNKEEKNSSQGLGFVFDKFSDVAFFSAIQNAIKVYRDSDSNSWNDIQRQNMRSDFSWFEPASEYLYIYKEVLKQERYKNAEVGIQKQLNKNSQLLQAIVEIDSLPGIFLRDRKEVLKQSVRLIRELIGCDAIFMWTLPGHTQMASSVTAFQDMELAASTFAHTEDGIRKQPDENLLRELLNQDIPGSWLQTDEMALGPNPREITGILDTLVAKDEGWIAGKTIPINAHSRVLGRIDILFTKKISQEESEWLDQVLITIANSFGFRLENIRQASKSDRILNIATKLLGVRTLKLTIDFILEEAKSISRADGAWLYLVRDDELKEIYSLGDLPNTDVANKKTIEAITDKKVKYLRDWRINQIENQPSVKYRALMSVPLIFENTVIGILEVASCTPAAFSHDHESFLINSLAPQAANALHSSLLHEHDEKIQKNQIKEFSDNLKKLSESLASSLDRKTLFQNIVDTITNVLQVDAASLYLADEKGDRLNIQAASGYQKPLVIEGAFYTWGQGVTGRIAQSNHSFVANSLDALRKEGQSPKGQYDDQQGGNRPQAFYGMPLNVVGKDKPIGVLKAERLDPRPFTSDDQLLIDMMGNVIAAVVYNTQQSEKRLRNLSANLTKLSGVLAGSEDMQTLLQNIVDTITAVLQVDAASLFLADEKGEGLNIQAASGYQKPLVNKKVFYKWGQGVTGRIAQSNRPFVANSLDELRTEGRSPMGKYDDQQGGNRPQAFYGMPLNVVGKDKPIGVLKAERLDPRPFTSDDQLLIDMMGNVIAAVVYNTQQSEKRLRNLSANLTKLSGVLAGGLDMQTLLQNIVDTITAVLQVDAASLFLADEKGERLNIQAASGYQKPLVNEGVYYTWGQGVTGRIAQSNHPFVANSLDALRKEGQSPKGQYDDQQGGNRPQAFYGMPLNVAKKDQPIGVLKAERLDPRPFTSDDQLLIDMMGNVIAAVVYNTQLDQARLNKIVVSLGSLAEPKENATQNLLFELSQSTDPSITIALGASLSAGFENDLEKAYQETKLLLENRASPRVYQVISDFTQGKTQRFLKDFNHAIRAKDIHDDRMTEVLRFIYLWHSAQINQDKGFGFREFINALGETCLFNVISESSIGNWTQFLLNTSRTFEGTYLPTRLSIVFHLFGAPQDALDFLQLRDLGTQHSENEKPILIVPLWGDDDVLEAARISINKNVQGPFAIDTAILTIRELQRIIGSNKPHVELQKIILPQVNLAYISPYKEHGPVAKDIFFGRDRELAQIFDGLKHHTNYAVIGGRRIGKSSILLQLVNQWLPSANMRATYYDIEDVVDLDDFLAREIDWPESNNGEEALPRTFGELFKSPPNDKPLVIFLDEVDKFVTIDRDPKNKQWAIFKTLRAFANNKHGVFVFGGEFTLQEALRDSSSPAYNLADQILLGPLEYSAVQELVCGPMRRLGIILREEEEIIKTIYEGTLGHPNIVQKLCIRLIKRLNDSKTRIITLPDVISIIEDHEFQEKDFLETLWEKSNLLEKIISLVLVGKKETNTLLEISAILLGEKISANPSEIQTALTNLVNLRLILSRTKDGYSYSANAFPKILENSNLVTDKLFVLHDEYMKLRGTN